MRQSPCSERAVHFCSTCSTTYSRLENVNTL
ncbi:hypothetical protein QTP70_014962 [Hemibagrus guttatus]|uniref:Uncharacterized protein n=1 Tax=Hemibagrus guttatus TaxID=175788 RepID=A0AAE0QE96_9TELE|nr:hypothetical protein QTP70_014962 [Hemibagrus guttatus]